MKIKEGFILCPYMGKTVVVPSGNLEDNFNGIIKMNETSVDVWKWVEEGKELQEIYSLYAEDYSVDMETATHDVDFVVEQMKQAGVFED